MSRDTFLYTQPRFAFLSKDGILHLHDEEHAAQHGKYVQTSLKPTHRDTADSQTARSRASDMNHFPGSSGVLWHGSKEPVNQRKHEQPVWNPCAV
ncbi:hypothetical protein [Paenibacillus sp. NRS-1781]|uniref:hypothetical protein n=1 Tax=Paenibacillus sp. NRS-1781 TaxID=3233905 RepID=UPI003D2AEF68